MQTQQYSFSQTQMKQYTLCPDVNYQGGHLGGISSCVYCAQIYRRYRKLQGQTISVKQQQSSKEVDEQQDVELEAPQQTKKFNKKVDDDGDCTKLGCMKAGFCVCQ